MTLSTAEIDAILAHFELPASSAVAPLGGWAGQNYLVSTPAQHYVIKLLPPARKALLANDLAIQAQLRAAGITAPTYCTDRRGACLYEQGAICALVTARIEGVHAQTLSLPFCFAMGAALAAFHAAVRTLPVAHQGWLNPATVSRSVPQRSPAPHARRAMRLFDEHRAIFARNLPAGIIHGDFQENNVLISSAAQPTVIAVLDFEESEANLLLVDLARTILSICRSADGTRLLATEMERVVRGYESVRPLAARERESLGDALRYVIGAEVLWLDQHGFADDAAEHVERADELPALGWWAGGLGSWLA